MVKILIDSSDGRYSTRPLTDEEAAKHDEAGNWYDVTHLADNVYESYLRHCDRDAMWQAHWRAISNEQYMRRRERELMPLEDAEREIRRLKDDLAQAKRMWTFYEEQNDRRLGELHRTEYVQYTCVYPQPGCQIDALPAEWHERAEELLAQYRPDRENGGLKYQGCCCGHQHKLLDDEAAAKLRTAGFVVENDSEEVDR